jgi:hypothetical protein
MHGGFSQFAAFDQDVIDDRAFVAKNGKLPMPVLAIGGEKSFGLTMAVVARRLQQRAGALHSRQRPLADGRAAQGHGRRDPRLPR